MTAPPPIGRFAFIDHLRGISALAVAVFHAFGSIYGAAMWAPLAPFASFAELGWQGVHVFFVLSGFCIAAKISSLSRSSLGVRAFVRDRFWRIVPAYWLTLVGCVLLGLAAAPFNGRPFSSALPPSALAWFTDLVLLRHWFGIPSLLLVSWTLAYEGAFYLLAALLLMVRPSVGERGILVAGSLLTIACFVIPSPGLDTPLRFWPEFWIGFLVHACLTRQHVWRGVAIAGALGFAASIVPGDPSGQLHGISVLTAMILLCTYRYDEALSGWGPWRWLGRVGAWSYSLYLIHAPLLSRTINLGRRYISPDSPGYVLLLLGALAFTLCCAWTFSRLVEVPIEHWRRRPRVSPARQTA